MEASNFGRQSAALFYTNLTSTTTSNFLLCFVFEGKLIACLSSSGTWTRILTIWQTLSCRLLQANGGPEGESIHWGEVASVSAHNPWLKCLTLLICALFPPQMATLCGRSCPWRRRRQLFHFSVLLENSTGLSFVLGNRIVYMSGDTIVVVCPLMSLFSQT